MAAARLAMQSWDMAPAYFSDEVWERLMDGNVNSVAALEACVTHSYKVGLRAPSEATQAMFTALMVFRESDEKRRQLQASSSDLRMLFLNIKSRVHGIISKMRSAGLYPLPNQEYVTQLPSNPSQASDAVRQVAFPPLGEAVVQPRWNLVSLQQLASQVPMRSTNRSATPQFATRYGDHHPDIMTQAMMAMAHAAMSMGQIRRPEASVTILPRSPSPLEDLLSRASSNTSLPPQQSPPLLALENGPNESSGNKANVSVAPCVDVAQQASVKPQGNDVTVPQKTDVQPDVDLDVRPDVQPAAQAAPSQPVACQRFVLGIVSRC